MKKGIRSIAFLTAVFLLFTFTGCRKSVMTDGDGTVSSLSELTSSENAASFEDTSTESEPSSSEDEISSQAPSSEIPSESAPSSVPQPTPSTPKPDPAPPYVPPIPPVIEIAPEFVVNDPANLRGLSEKSLGYGHGQTVSIDNQTRFNAMEGVEALAIDVKTGQKCVYLTFDCGYEYENLTASILDTLKGKNVKAAFFCTLSYIKKNPQLVWRMINEGHIVGNHSATHPVFPNISRTKMAKEVYDVHKYLQENFGYTPKYFRFPSGTHSHSSLELVSSIGYKNIFWSFAYVDWDTSKQPTTAAALPKLQSAFYPGSVILLHAVSRTNTELMSQIIDYGLSQGYTFNTLDQYYAQ